MAFSDLLDDENIQENLDTDLVLQYSRNIAQRVRFLTFFFACFALAQMILTYKLFTNSPRHSIGFLILAFAIMITQGGSIYMTFRLFFYQKSILNTNNWIAIFDNKYKVWRAFALTFLFSLVPISYLMLDSILYHYHL